MGFTNGPTEDWLRESVEEGLESVEDGSIDVIVDESMVIMLMEDMDIISIEDIDIIVPIGGMDIVIEGIDAMLMEDMVEDGSTEVSEGSTVEREASLRAISG